MMIRIVFIVAVASSCWTQSATDIVPCDWRDANGEQLYPNGKCEAACERMPPQDGPLCHLGSNSPLPPGPSLDVCHSFVDEWGVAGCCLSDGPAPYDLHPIKFWPCQ